MNIIHIERRNKSRVLQIFHSSLHSMEEEKEGVEFNIVVRIIAIFGKIRF